MKRIYFCISVLALFSVSLSAKQYPDSIRQASMAEHTIRSGFTFDVYGGVGLGSSTFSFIEDAPRNHSTNGLAFPSWDAGIGLNCYFAPWIGLGTGVDFATYRSLTKITGSYTAIGEDIYGGPQGEYILTSRPDGVRETATLRYVEVPLLLKFRVQPRRVVGFQANMGVKFAMPISGSYRLADGGSFRNEVYYPHWDLTMSNVPHVIQDQTVNGASGTINREELAKINYVGHLELGMLFRLHQRVDMSLMVYGDYFFNDAMPRNQRKNLGFSASAVGEYASAFPTSYQGVLYSNEVSTLHPWDVGVRVGFHFHAGRTVAQRRYDRQMREERKRQRAEAKLAAATAALVMDEPEPVEETEPVAEADTMAEWMAKRDSAIAEIKRLAGLYDIDLCDLCGMSTVIVHDTIYVHIEHTIEPTPAELLEELLERTIIYFRYDRYDNPIVEPEDILVRIADILRRHPEMRVHVDGHASPEGPAGYNLTLSLRRAKTVAAELRKLGVKDEQMIIASFGASHPFRYQGKQTLAKDRRVEVYPEGTKPATMDTTLNPVGANVETVLKGSRLAQIARRHYGEPEYWVFIWEANFEKVPNPNVLNSGIDLLIPNLQDRLVGKTREQILTEAAELRARLERHQK